MHAGARRTAETELPLVMAMWLEVRTCSMVGVLHRSSCGRSEWESTTPVVHPAFMVAAYGQQCFFSVKVPSSYVPPPSWFPCKEDGPIPFPSFIVSLISLSIVQHIDLVPGKCGHAIHILVPKGNRFVLGCNISRFVSIFFSQKLPAWMHEELFLYLLESPAILGVISLFGCMPKWYTLLVPYRPDTPVYML
jgi:hypothetical protein